MDPVLRIFSARAVADSRWWNCAPNVVLSSAPRPSGCVTTRRPASTATTSRGAGRFRSPSSAPRARSRMSALSGISESANYFSRLGTLAWLSRAQLVRAPSHSRRAEAARRSARHVVLLMAIVGVGIIALMYALDVREISLMPPRGTPGLWPVRILTDFGKDIDVLGALGGLLIAVAIVAAGLHGIQRSLLLGLGTRLQFLFFAVLVSVLAGELIKWIVGRGRPFVGGQANAFN